MLFLGDLGIQLGGLSSASTPSATASSCSTRSKPSPAAASTPTSTASAASRTTCPRAGSPRPRWPWRRCATFCDEVEDLLIGNEIFQMRTRGVGVIPADIALSYGLSGPNVRGSGIDWDLRRDNCPPGLVYDKVDWKVWTHPDGDASPAPGSASRRSASPPRSSTSCSTASRAGRSWPRSPASSRCPRARPRSPPRTRSARWATTSSPRATSCRSGSRSARRRSTTSRSCRGCAGRLRPRRHHHPRQPLLHPRVTSTDDPHRSRRSTPPTGSPTAIKLLVVSHPGADHRAHPRHRLPVQGHVVDAEPQGPAGGRSPRPAPAAGRRRPSSCRRKT